MTQGRISEFPHPMLHGPRLADSCCPAGPTTVCVCVCGVSYDLRLGRPGLRPVPIRHPAPAPLGCQVSWGKDKETCTEKSVLYYLNAYVALR